MTMVAASLFNEGAVLISDSRATKNEANQQTFSDTLQKILYVQPNLALAYAGDVHIAGEIAKEIRVRLAQDEKLKTPQDLAAALQYMAQKLYMKYTTINHRIHSVSLILAGIESSGKINVWVYKSPLFNPIKLDKGFVVIGSGEVVSPYLENNYERINNSYKDIKSKADELIVGLESELQKHGIDTVGGLFQIITLSPDGIRPLRYGFMDLNPESSGYAKSIELKKGRWTQKDETSGEKIELIEPSKININLFQEKRFHEYKLPEQDKKTPRWYVAYFITCLKVNRSISTTEFEGVLSQIGSFRYPRTIPLTASLGFWGTTGEHEIEFRIEKDGEVKTISARKISTKYLPELVEVDTQLVITAESPGSMFLECLIDKQLLARKAMYFGKPEVVIKSQEEYEAFCKNYPQKLKEEHSQYEDSFLKEKQPLAEYFILCEDYAHEGCNIRFVNEMKSVYWNSYPLLLKVLIASALRLTKGKHNVRIDLVNAATRYTSNITDTIIENSSDCLSTPIYGQMVVKIPEPGIYFFNLYADDKFITSAILPVEPAEARYSYSLLEEDEKQVKSGELLILPRRSMQKPSEKRIRRFL